jgi:cholesterol transport system auxiliary component
MKQLDNLLPMRDAPNRAPRRVFLRGIGALSLASALSGCGVGELLPGQGPPPRLFRLSPKSTFDPDLPTVDWQLVIEEPISPTGLSTTRIPLQRRAVELEYYARANWTDRAPAMVHTLAVESFENSNRIIAVGRESFGLRSDFILKLDLREFQTEYSGDGPPDAHVRLNAKLVQMPQRTIIGSQRFTRKITAKADTLEDIVAAFDDALGKVLKELVAWSLRSGQNARG